MTYYSVDIPSIGGDKEEKRRMTLLTELCDRLNAFRNKEDEPWEQYKKRYQEELEEWRENESDREDSPFQESAELLRLERAARERDYYQDVVLPFATPVNEESDGEFLKFDFGLVYFNGQEWRAENK